MLTEVKVIIACILVLVGIYGKSRWDDHAKLKDAVVATQTAQNEAAGADKATVAKLRHDAAVDAGVNHAKTKSRELERNDPSYRDYLDRPLPDSTLRVYHDAAEQFRAAERACAAGADARCVDPARPATH